MKLAHILLVLLVAASAYAGDDELVVRQKYRSSGSVRMHLQSGDYTITGTNSDDIVISYGARTLSAVQHVHAKIEAGGADAIVYVTNTPNNDFHAEIELPAKSGLWVRLTAGDLTISGVEGDKDVDTRAGDIEIQVPHPEQYGKVESSNLAGDIDASPFGGSKSGIFRSFDWHGPGQYRLRVHVMAGDIKLRESD